jgi:hypothetical protein
MFVNKQITISRPTKDTVNERSAPRPLEPGNGEATGEGRGGRGKGEGGRGRDGSRPASRLPACRAARAPACQTDIERVGVPCNLVTRRLDNEETRKPGNQETTQPPEQLTFADGAGLGLIVCARRSMSRPMITLAGACQAAVCRPPLPSRHSLPPTCPRSSSRSGPQPCSAQKNHVRSCEPVTCRRVKAAHPPSPIHGPCNM